MRNHDGATRGFYIQSQQWYYPISPKKPDIKEEIWIGMFYEEGGTSCEFAIVWKKMGDHYSPRLEVFDDAWDGLWLFSDLLEGLRAFDFDEHTETTPDQIVALLLKLGIKDLTKRQKPTSELSAPEICPCCKQTIEVKT